MSWGAVLSALKVAAPYVSAVAPVVAGAARGSAQGREQQHRMEDQSFRTAQNAQMDRALIDIKRKEFTEESRMNRAKQAALADLLMNYSPTRVSVKGIPDAQIGGGTRLGAGGRQGLGEMQKQALAKLLSGDTFEGGQILNAPTVPRAGRMERLAGLVGTGGSILGALDAAGAFGGDRDYVPPYIGQTSGLPGQVGQNMGVPGVPALPNANAGLNPELYRHLFTGA